MVVCPNHQLSLNLSHRTCWVRFLHDTSSPYQIINPGLGESILDTRVCLGILYMSCDTKTCQFDLILDASKCFC